MMGSNQMAVLLIASMLIYLIITLVLELENEKEKSKKLVSEMPQNRLIQEDITLVLSMENKW
jgi:hypothetical protein